MIDIEKLKDRVGSIGDKIIVIGFIATFLNQFNVDPFYGFSIILIGVYLVYFSISKE